MMVKRILRVNGIVGVKIHENERGKYPPRCGFQGVYGGVPTWDPVKWRGFSRITKTLSRPYMPGYTMKSCSIVRAAVDIH